MDLSDVENGYMLNCNGYHGITHADLTHEDFVCLEVSGFRFITLKRTLEKFPSTLLGSKRRRDEYYVQCRNAYFFDRSSIAFAAILHYYQSGGIIIRPPNVPMAIFCDEIKFFDLGPDVTSKLKEKEGYISEHIPLPDKEWQRKVWELFECPHSSIWARFVSLWSIFVITVSVTVFCVETLPEFQHTHQENTTVHPKDYREPDKVFIQPWFSLEISCIAWFTLEYILRFISSPNKCQFLRSFLNIIDILAILPYYITITIRGGNFPTSLAVLRAVRLFRVFRIFKLSRYSTGLRILGHTLKASLSELGMLILFLMLGVILFSSAIFYAEQGENDSMFRSIPETFWFTLVTMTTVGYGDMVPKTIVGKFIGSLCTLTGVLTIALPVPVIAANFDFFYKRDLYDDGKEPTVSSGCEKEKPRESLLKA